MRNDLYLTSLQWLRNESGSRRLTQIAQFLLHVLGSTVIFALIALLTVGVNYATLYLQNLGVDQIILNLMKGAEYSVMIVNILLLVFSIAVNAFHDFRG